MGSPTHNRAAAALTALLLVLSLAAVPSAGADPVDDAANADDVSSIAGLPSAAGGPSRRYVAVVDDGAGGIEVRSYAAPASVAAGDAIAALSADPDVIVAEVDGSWTPTGIDEQLYPVAAGAPAADRDPITSWHIDSVRAPDAWDRDAGGTVVAVLDTGVDASHPDFAGAVLPGYDFVHDVPTNTDNDWHGTFVAGMIVAETGNGIGIDGTVNGVRVLPGTVCDGACMWSDVAQGITWAVDAGADVINLSIAGPSSASVSAALEYARENGVVAIAAAGNDGDDGNPRVYPASYPTALGVGAIAQGDVATAWASYGDWVDLSGPGELVTSTVPGTTYAMASGTSFSSPQVAATAALGLSIAGDLVPAEIEALLMGSARDVHQPGWDAQTGHGNLDVGAFVDAVDSFPTAPSSLTYTAVDSQNVKLSWDPVPGVETYQVRVDALDATTITTGTTQLVSSTALDHDIEVRALTVSGRSGEAAVLSPGPEAEPLGAPVIDVDAGDGEVVVSWDAVTDAESYGLWLDGAEVATTAALTYTFDGLDNNVDVVVGVDARSDASPTSAVTAATATPEAPEPAPKPGPGPSPSSPPASAPEPEPEPEPDTSANEDGGERRQLPLPPREALADTPSGTVHRVYLSLFGRVGDNGGLSYWVGRHAVGVPMSRIVSAMVGSSEWASRYGTLTSREFATLLYEGVLGRTPDAGGLNYWTRQLDTGAISEALLIMMFVESNELRTQIRDRIAAG